jgi:hypothetical protein
VRGQLPPDTDAKLAAHGLYAFVGGIMRDWVQSPKSYNLELAGPAFVDLYLSGLKANPPRKRAARPSAAAVPAERKARSQPSPVDKRPAPRRPG